MLIISKLKYGVISDVVFLIAQTHLYKHIKWSNDNKYDSMNHFYSYSNLLIRFDYAYRHKIDIIFIIDYNDGFTFMKIVIMII